MFTISLDPSQLSIAQRDAVAQFIRSYPTDTAFAAIPVVEEEEETATEQTPESAFASADATPISVDKNGFPWDARIHTSSRATNADGTWRYKRGADKAVIAQVEGELRQLAAIPATPSNVVTLPAPVAVPAPPAPAAVIVPAPPAADPKKAYVDLIEMASKAIGEGKLTTDQLTSAAVAAGLTAITDLAKRLDLVPQVSSTLTMYMAAAS